MVQHALILLLSITCFSGFAQDRRAAFFQQQAVASGGTSFPVLSGIYARYYSGNWSGFANGNSIAVWTNTAGPASNLVVNINAGSTGYWTNNVGIANGNPWIAVPAANGGGSYTNTMTCITPVSIFLLFQGYQSGNGNFIFHSPSGVYLDDEAGVLTARDNACIINASYAHPIMLSEMIFDIDGNTSSFTTNKVSVGTCVLSAGAGLSGVFKLTEANNDFAICNFWELVVCTNVVTGTELTNLRNYFTATYGIP